MRARWLKEYGAKNHRWSVGAAYCGIVVALVLMIPSDVPANWITGLLCPGAVLIAVILKLFGISAMSLAGYVFFIAGASAGNGIWYMLVTETCRMALERLQEVCPRKGQ